MIDAALSEALYLASGPARPLTCFERCAWALLQRRELRHAVYCQGIAAFTAAHSVYDARLGRHVTYAPGSGMLHGWLQVADKVIDPGWHRARLTYTPARTWSRSAVKRLVRLGRRPPFHTL